MNEIISKTEKWLKKPITDTEGLENVLGCRAELELAEEKTRNAKEAELQKIAQKYDPLIREISSKLEEVDEHIINYLELNKDEMMKNGIKTMQLESGKVGYKLKRAKLELEKGQTWDNVVKELREKGYTTLVRIKYEADKVEMLKRSEEEDIKALYKELGINVVKGSEVFIKTKH